MAQAITSLVKYKDVEKLNVQTGVFERFFPLRAVGLGYERGHKLVHNGGLEALTWESVRTVTVFPGRRGAVRVLRGRTPRTVQSQSLTLRKEDAALAEKLVHKQLNVLGKDLEFNIDGVDVPSVTGSFDLLGHFRKVVHNCGGRLWAELKAFSAGSYDKSVEEQKKVLPERFVREKKKDASLCGVLLVCAKVARCGKDWGEPTLTVSLWRAETQTWYELAGSTVRKGRGQCKSSKPSLRKTLEGVEWVKDENNHKKGYLKHFLREAGLPDESAHKRARTFNAQLTRDGHSDQIEQLAVLGKCGKRPWLASKNTLRKVYKLV